MSNQERFVALPVKIGDLLIPNVAPVLIPTLNRSKHLKALLDSLSKCNLADQTEVFIAVDYPLKESHWKGYNEILALLDKGGDFGFKKLHVLKREKNYGFGKNGNMISLAREVLKTHDRYIASEDDNTFAPTFLEFMNYNLERYKDDPSVFSISGYMYPLEENHMEFKTLKLSHFSAWGTAYWKNKKESYNVFVENIENIKHLRDNKSLEKYFRKKQQSIFNGVIGMSMGQPILGDTLITAYQYHFGLKSIFPSQTLVHNNGWDGSGLHGGIKESYLNQSLYSNPSLDLEAQSDGKTSDFIDDKIYNFFRSDRPLIQHILTNISYYGYKITGKYNDFNSLRNLWKKFFR